NCRRASRLRTELPPRRGVCSTPEFSVPRELSMSMSNGEAATKNLTDKAQERFENERLEKEVNAVKNDIAALTDQITDAINSFAGTATKQARRGYDQARSRAEETMDDMSERGSAMFDAAHDAASSLEESLEDVITQRPLATI